MNCIDIDPYGQATTTALTGGHIDQPLRFTGQYQDPTGLYKMGLRYYHPDLARWTQPDPALSTGQLPFANTYTYIANNPTNYIDPTGADYCWGTAFNVVVGGAGLAASIASGGLGGFVGGVGSAVAFADGLTDIYTGTCDTTIL